MLKYILSLLCIILECMLDTLLFESRQTVTPNSKRRFFTPENFSMEPFKMKVGKVGDFDVKSHSCSTRKIRQLSYVRLPINEFLET